MVIYLISEGANVHMKDNWGKTAFDLASENNHNEVARYLEEVMSGR